MGTTDRAYRSWLAAIVESSDDAIVSKDLDGVVTSWNAAAERLFGHPAEEMVGRHISAIAAPGREAEMAMILERIRRGETVDHFETRRRHKDGRILDVSLSVSPVRDGRGRIVGASKIARDIGERLRARRERGLLAAIVASSDDAIASKDLDGVVTSWNAAAERLFGYSAEEMVGRHVSILAAPGREAEMAMILDRVRGGERVEHFETRRRRKDGRVVEVSLTVSPIRDEEGRIIGASKIARDIGDRLRVQSDRGLLAAIVASSDDAIASKDLDGVVTSWNAAAERLFGHPAEEMVGRHISVIAAPGREAEMPMILERIRRGETVDHFETRRRHKDGRILDVSLTVSPIRDEAGRIVGASKIARDIGERKSTERRLRLMADELDHRAKNVLAVAQAMLRLTRADDVQQYVAAVEGRIAALARAHAQVAESHWRGADLAPLVRSGLEPFRADLGRLTVSGPVALLGPVAAQALSIVLHELATNAAKHGSLSVPDGSVEVSWTVAGDGDLTLRWVESGGPPVAEPARRSFGSRVIERQVPDQLGGDARIEWAVAGLVCEFRIPAAHLSPAPARGRAARRGA